MATMLPTQLLNSPPGYRRKTAAHNAPYTPPLPLPADPRGPSSNNRKTNDTVLAGRLAALHPYRFVAYVQGAPRAYPQVGLALHSENQSRLWEMWFLNEPYSDDEDDDCGVRLRELGE